MKKNIFSQEKYAPDSKLLTTSEFAKLCGVTRFTVRNWVDLGKIKFVKTIGGHRRIPDSEVVSFIRIHEQKDNKSPKNRVLHCWQYAKETRCGKECEKCLAYIQKIDYCFLAVKQLGKKRIRCEGHCLDCSYFNEIFEQMKMLKNPDIKKVPASRQNIIG